VVIHHRSSTGQCGADQIMRLPSWAHPRAPEALLATLAGLRQLPEVGVLHVCFSHVHEGVQPRLLQNRTPGVPWLDKAD